MKKVLNEMGRNDSDFFQELTQAFHQVRPSQTFCFCLGEVVILHVWHKHCGWCMYNIHICVDKGDRTALKSK